MLRQRTRTVQAAIAISDAFTTLAAFYAAYYLAGPIVQRHTALKQVLPINHYYWVPLVSVPMWWVLFAFFKCYDLSPIERKRESLLRLWSPLIVGILAVAAFSFFQKNPLFSRRVVAAISLANVLFILVGRAIVLTVAARAFRKTGGMRRILYVGDPESARAFGRTVRKAGWGLELAGFVSHRTAADAPDSMGTLDDLPDILDRQTIDDVVIAGASDFSDVQRAIGVCEEVGVAIHIPSDFFNAVLSRPHLEPFFGIPMLTFSTTPYNPVSLGIKRACDICLGTLLLLLFALPMLVIAVVIKLTSRGPVLFRQERGGLYGRTFTMLKFRSMFVGADAQKDALSARNEADGPAFKMRDDPRVTPFGRFLRKYSLDELPQLWNVIKGDMSLVGPSPPLPGEMRRYERRQRRRLSMRPGLTCIWQVSGRRHSSFEKWMADDLAYIDNWSLLLDLKIIIRTIPVILKGTGV